MVWCAKFYKDRILQLVAIIGAVASVVGVGIPGLFSESGVVLWRLALLLIVTVPFMVAAIWLVFKSEHLTRVYSIGADKDISNYLYRWIQTGRHVLICTRDMSWADEPSMMDLLKNKASSQELTIVLPEEVERSNRLRAMGAEVIAYGALEPLTTHFTIVNFGQPGSRVAIGWRSGDRHLIQEFSAADEHPTFYLALDIVKLAKERNHVPES